MKVKDTKDFLFSSINLFDLKQSIYQCQDNDFILIDMIKTNDLANKLVEICYDKNIFEIKLSGNKDYLKGLMEKIITAEKFSHKINNIKIEMVGL